VPWPKLRPESGFVRHPWVQRQAEFNDLDSELGDDARRRLAIASYFGLVSFIDAQIGRVMTALSDAGLSDETLIIYTSDHGDNLGARGMWNKSLLYRESTAVPLILSGPGVPQRSCDTPASLVDVYQTVLEAFALPPSPEEAGLPGTSLIGLATRPDIERTAFSEYHAVGSPTAAFMVAHGRYKYHHYVGYEPELFDLEDDPQEAHDLARSGAHGAVREEFAQRLRAIVDPDMADRRAKDDQNLLVERVGGRAVAFGLGKTGATPVPQAAL
jgi:choline-sulfatase